MGRSEHLKYLPMITQGTAGTGLSVCKPNEIIKANPLTQHLIGNQFSLPTGRVKNQGENNNAASLHCEGLWCVQNDFTGIMPFSFHSNTKLARTLRHACML